MKDFTHLTTQNPCEECPAPCCQMQVLPWVTPKNLMGIDHLRFSLQFPGTEFIVSPNGDFSLVKWSTCQLFDEKKCSCSVHGTSKQPLTCIHFNPYQCWYKRNFVDAPTPPDLYRLNMPRYEIWVKKVEFDSNHNIAKLPSFTESYALIKDIPITPLFHLKPGLIKSPLE